MEQLISANPIHFFEKQNPNQNEQQKLSQKKDSQKTKYA